MLICAISLILSVHPARSVTPHQTREIDEDSYPTIYLSPSLFKQRSANENRYGKASNCNPIVAVSQLNSYTYNESNHPTAELA